MLKKEGPLIQTGCREPEVTSPSERLVMVSQGKNVGNVSLDEEAHLYCCVRIKDQGLAMRKS